MTTTTVTKLSELMEFLSTITTNDEIWFRGHSDSSWRLLPRLARMAKLDKESELIKRFELNAYPFLDRIPQKEWEWLFIMQHFGVPTRLLDWTESPLIGLYFCLYDIEGEITNDDKSATLWCLKPQVLNSRYNGEVPGFGRDAAGDLSDYEPERIRKGRFPYDIEPVAIIAPRQFDRIYAQQGVFTISHLSPIAVEECPGRDHVIRIEIPALAKDKLRKELKQLRITHLTVFPELESVAKNAMEVLK